MARVSGLAWYVLVHQLPPRPLYLRAKIRQRLARVGAIALKSSVYVLPRREDCLEDLEWIAEEARSGNGEAWIQNTYGVFPVSSAASLPASTARPASPGLENGWTKSRASISLQRPDASRRKPRSNGCRSGSKGGIGP